MKAVARMSVLVSCTLAFCLFGNGCRDAATEATGKLGVETGTAGRSQDRPVLHSLHPDSTEVGQPFNVQPNGDSAIAAQCANASTGTTIVFGTRALPTVYGGTNLLTAVVPPSLYSTPGKMSVFLRDERGDSNRLEFVVRPVSP